MGWGGSRHPKGQHPVGWDKLLPSVFCITGEGRAELPSGLASTELQP